MGPPERYTCEKGTIIIISDFIQSVHLIIVQFSTPVMSCHFDLEKHYEILKFKLSLMFD